MKIWPLMENWILKLSEFSKSYLTNTLRNKIKWAKKITTDLLLCVWVHTQKIIMIRSIQFIINTTQIKMVISVSKIFWIFILMQQMINHKQFGVIWKISMLKATSNLKINLKSYFLKNNFPDSNFIIIKNSTTFCSTF